MGLFMAGLPSVSCFLGKSGGGFRSPSLPPPVLTGSGSKGLGDTTRSQSALAFARADAPGTVMILPRASAKSRNISVGHRLTYRDDPSSIPFPRKPTGRFPPRVQLSTRSMDGRYDRCGMLPDCGQTEYNVHN